MATVTDPWAAMADPTRRTLLTRLAVRPSSASKVAEGLPMSRPAVSQHLKVLLAAGLVEARAEGRQRIYRVNADGLARLRRELDGFWRQSLHNFKQAAEGDRSGEEQS